jgi:hypothetical protein
MPYEIEKNVPIPTIKRKAPAEKYPFRHMEIGDSFFIPDETGTSVSGLVSAYGKKLGKKFSSRTVKDGARIWRLS